MSVAFIGGGCCQDGATDSPVSSSSNAPTKSAVDTPSRGTASDDKSAETPNISTSPVQTAVSSEQRDVVVTLDALGAKIDTNKDGSVKSVDFSGAKLSPHTVFAEADLARLSTARVVRGQGPIFPCIFQACASMKRLTEFLWSEAATDAGNFKVFLSKNELKKIRLTGLKTDSFGELLKILGAIPSLADLDVSGSNVVDDDLKVFDTPGFQKLVRLNLYKTGTSNRGVESLVRLAGQLVWLNLDATAVTDEGCKTIAKFKNLTFLHLGRTVITDAAAESLGSISSLKNLHVTRTAMTEKGFKLLKEKLPACEIVTVVGSDK